MSLNSTAIPLDKETSVCLVTSRCSRDIGHSENASQLGTCNLKGYDRAITPNRSPPVHRTILAFGTSGEPWRWWRSCWSGQAGAWYL